ncbi:uncharacterized protein [Macrobrachium rosenbergii]|uniref:uncharacterized protein n=1 Tax=Macrobrachium rosenbergii TaxID=79674 RepID=UPI0034D48478
MENKMGKCIMEDQGSFTVTQTGYFHIMSEKMHFAPPTYGNADEAFIKSGFRRWKKAHGKDGAIEKHISSQCHKTSCIAWADYQRNKADKTSIAQCISEAYQKKVRENRHYIKTLGEIILLTVTQDISQRGHREGDDELNPGNVRKILRFTAERDPIIADRMDLLDAASITDIILKSLDKLGLDYKSSLVGLGFDGASVMSGGISGVQKRIRDKAPFAYYIHCYGHRLNLMLINVAKYVPQAAEFFSLLEELYIFASNSVVHEKFILIQREMLPEEQVRELQHLSDTRWWCRATSCENALLRLECIMRLLKEISEDDIGARAVSARECHENAHRTSTFQKFSGPPAAWARFARHLATNDKCPKIYIGLKWPPLSES